MVAVAVPARPEFPRIGNFRNAALTGVLVQEGQCNMPVGLMKRDECDSSGALLLGEIEYVRHRLATSIEAAQRPEMVRALLEAIDSHARVRRLAAQLLSEADLSTVNAKLQELWALIHARSLPRLPPGTSYPAAEQACR